MDRNFREKIETTSDEELVAMARRAWPVAGYNKKKGTALIVNPDDLVLQGFDWFSAKEPLGTASRLYCIKSVGTYHTRPSSGFLPSAAEVLVQIKKHVEELDQKGIHIAAYAVDYGHRKQETKSFKVEGKVQSFHLGTVHLFTGAVRKAIRERDMVCRGTIYTFDSAPG